MQSEAEGNHYLNATYTIVMDKIFRHARHARHALQKNSSKIVETAIFIIKYRQKTNALKSRMGLCTLGLVLWQVLALLRAF